MKLMIASAIAVAGGIASYFAPAPGAGSPGIDTMNTASISAATPAGQGQQYSVANIGIHATCLLTRGHASTTRTDDVSAGSDCNDVWPRLAEARNWTENSDGTVVVSDASGKQLLQLGRGDGAAFETVDPPEAMLTLNPVR